MKLLIKIFSFFLAFVFFPVAAEAQQDDMFKQKKERKRIWSRWKRNREAYNPYVDSKAKKKPSARMAKSNRKELKHQKKVARKELRKNKRKFGSSG